MNNLATAPLATLADINNIQIFGQKAGLPLTVARVPVSLMTGLIAGTAAGHRSYATVAARDADASAPAGTIGYVYANNGSASDPANGYYQKNGGAWQAAAWLANLIGGVSAETQDLIAQLAPEVDAANTNAFLFGAATGATTTGTYNFCMAPSAGETLGAGSRNTIISPFAGQLVGAGNDNLLGGFLAAQLGANISTSVVLGPWALRASTTNSFGHTVTGAYAGEAYQGNELCVYGKAGFQNATNGARLTGVGTGVGTQTTTGQRQTLVGYDAQGGAANDNVIVIGDSAAATGSRQIVLGTDQQHEMRMFGVPFAYHDPAAISTDPLEPFLLHNFYLLRGAPVNTPTTGARNLSIGRHSGGRHLSATNCLAICEAALELHTGTGLGGVEGKGNNTIAIGVQAAQLGLALADSVITGVLAGQEYEYITGATVYGFRAQQKGKGAQNPTAIGDSALWVNKRDGNVGIGYVVAEYNQFGTESFFGGRGTVQYRDGTSYSVVIGHGALGLFSEDPNVNKATGVGAPLCGDRINVIGHSGAIEYRGGNLVGMGTNVARSLVATTAHLANGIYLGNDCGYHPNQKSDAVNQIIIAHGGWSANDNHVVIGNNDNDRFTFGQTTFTRAQLNSLLALVA